MNNSKLIILLYYYENYYTYFCLFVCLYIIFICYGKEPFEVLQPSYPKQVEPLKDVIHVISARGKIEEILSTYDAENYELIGENIPTGIYPVHAEISYDKKHMYVANHVSSDITVIDLIERKQLGTIKLCSKPVFITTTGLSDLLFVLHFESKLMTVISPQKMHVIKTVTLPEQADAIQFNKRDNYLYVSHFQSGQVSVIDPKTLDILNIIPKEKALDAYQLTSFSTKDDKFTYFAGKKKRDNHDTPNHYNVLRRFNNITNEEESEIEIGYEFHHFLSGFKETSIYIPCFYDKLVLFFDTEDNKIKSQIKTDGHPINLNTLNGKLFVATTRSLEVIDIDTPQIIKSIRLDCRFSFIIPTYYIFHTAVTSDPFINQILISGQPNKISLRTVKNGRKAIIFHSSRTPPRNEQDYIKLKEIVDFFKAGVESLIQRQTDTQELELLESFFKGAEIRDMTSHPADDNGQKEEILHEWVGAMMKKIYDKDSALQIFHAVKKKYSRECQEDNMDINLEFDTLYSLGFDDGQIARAKFALLYKIAMHCGSDKDFLKSNRQEQLRHLYFLQGAYLGYDIPLYAYEPSGNIRKELTDDEIEESVKQSTETLFSAIKRVRRVHSFKN